jgi:hypothetical protein
LLGGFRGADELGCLVSPLDARGLFGRVLRPVFQRLEHRIRAYVLVWWSAISLTHVAEWTHDHADCQPIPVT